MDFDDFICLIECLKLLCSLFKVLVECEIEVLFDVFDVIIMLGLCDCVMLELMYVLGLCVFEFVELLLVGLNLC